MLKPLYEMGTTQPRVVEIRALDKGGLIGVGNVARHARQEFQDVQSSFGWSKTNGRCAWQDAYRLTAIPPYRPSRDVAQSGSAPEWGSGGRRFESGRPD